MKMKSDVIKKSKEIAIPNNRQRKKVDKIANQVFSLVNKEAEKQKSIVSVHFGGSYAKETWTCLLYTSPSPRDQRGSGMAASA